MSDAQEGRDIGFEFNGNAKEYFKIWIVNIALSIVTLGIYSAWAKVRTKRYFYGNTTLDGSNFEYHADPLDILKGRLILLAVFIVYFFSKEFVPLIGALFILVFYLAGLPWMFVKSMQFNTRNSSFRNVRFDFEGTTKEAAKLFIGMILLTIVTLGLATPYTLKRIKEFSIENSCFGSSPFEFGATVGDFYRIYLKAIIAPMIIVAIIGIIAAVAIPAYNGFSSMQQMQPQLEQMEQLESQMEQMQPNIEELEQMSPEQQQEAIQAQIEQMSANLNNQGNVPATDAAAAATGMAVAMLMMLPYLLMIIYIQTRITNLVLCSTSLEGHELHSTLRVRTMFYIYLTNIVAAIVSLGLLIPWCKIRLIRYRLDNLSLITEGDLNGFIANEQDNVKATGGEFADAFDLDMGF